MRLLTIQLDQALGDEAVENPIQGANFQLHPPARQRVDLTHDPDPCRGSPTNAVNTKKPGSVIRTRLI